MSGYTTLGEGYFVEGEKKEEKEKKEEETNEPSSGYQPAFATFGSFELDCSSSSSSSSSQLSSYSSSSSQLFDNEGMGLSYLASSLIDSTNGEEEGKIPSLLSLPSYSDVILENDQQQQQEEEEEHFPRLPTYTSSIEEFFHSPGDTDLLVSLSGEEGDEDRKWSSEWISLTSKRDTQGLSSLAFDFVETAGQIGRLIVQELSLPAAKKTILPVSLGGIAGGEKYISKGILFKLCRDVYLSNSYLYGGDHPDINLANRAAGHELRGLDFFLSATHETHTPISTSMAALVDFRGFRLVALSLIPIQGQNTLVWGSADGGHSMRNSSPKAGEYTKTIGKHLGLAPHHICNVETYGPGDLEIHQSNDQKFFALDFARLFPPEDPQAPNELTSYKGVLPSRAIYYHLLRPELLRRSDVPPLSSDAFTGFSAKDPNRSELNKNVELATKIMFEKAIPETATRLDELLDNKNNIKNFSSLILNSMHQWGVNLRHLGVVRAKMTKTLPRILVLTEMCVRVIKDYIREKSRECAMKLTTSHERPFYTLLVHCFNTILNSSSESISFWGSLLPSLLSKKYRMDINECFDTELDPHQPVKPPALVDWSTSICFPILFKSLLKVFNISLRDISFIPILKDTIKDPKDLILPKMGILRSTDCRLHLFDIIDVKPRVKQMGFVSRMAGKAALEEINNADPKKTAFNIRFAESLLDQAHTFFCQSLERVYTDSETHLGLSRVYMRQHCMNLLRKETDMSMSKLNQALFHLELVLKWWPDSLDGCLMLCRCRSCLVIEYLKIDKMVLAEKQQTALNEDVAKLVTMTTERYGLPQSEGGELVLSGLLLKLKERAVEEEICLTSLFLLPLFYAFALVPLLTSSTQLKAKVLCHLASIYINSYPPLSSLSRMKKFFPVIDSKEGSDSESLLFPSSLCAHSLPFLKEALILWEDSPTYLLSLLSPKSLPSLMSLPLGEWDSDGLTKFELKKPLWDDPIFSILRILATPEWLALTLRNFSRLLPHPFKVCMFGLVLSQRMETQFDVSVTLDRCLNPKLTRAAFPLPFFLQNAGTLFRNLIFKQHVVNDALVAALFHCSNLTSLELEASSSFNSFLKFRAILELPQLDSLTLVSCQAKEDELQQFISAFSSKSLKKLALLSLQFDKSVVFKAQDSPPSLSDLTIRSASRLSPEILNVISPLLSTLAPPSLRSLFVDLQGLNASHAHIYESIPIETFTVGSHANSDWLLAFFSSPIRQEIRRLTINQPPRLSKEAWSSLSNCGSLHSLHVRGAFRPDPVFRDVMKAVVKPQITHINFQCMYVHELTDEETDRNLVNLKILLMDTCPGKSDLRPSFFQSLSNLVHLKFRKARFEMRRMAHLTNLESIMLIDCVVPDISSSMGLVLANNKNLQKLHVSGTTIPEDALILANFGDTSAKERALDTLSNLEHLHISNCFNFLVSRFSKWLLTDFESKQQQQQQQQQQGDKKKKRKRVLGWKKLCLNSCVDVLQYPLEDQVLSSRLEAMFPNLLWVEWTESYLEDLKLESLYS